MNSSPSVAAASRPDFRARLRDELARRRRVNRRYSVRAFGEFLGVDHSTLSQVLRGVRPVPAGCLRKWAARLKLGTEETEFYAAADGGDDFETLARRVRHMQWMSEAAALMANSAHWRLLQLLRAPDWRPDIRWAARRLETDVDQVNEALSRLLRLGLLRIEEGRWRDLSGLGEPDAGSLVEVALARLRGTMSGA
jgi:transcriptional regulator with XRE-family HTH domain